MSLTKDGFYKQIAGVKGDNTYLLLAGGGHQKLGNASGNVPISNGTLNVDLNADKLDGVHLSGIFTDFSGGAISSSGNTLTQANHSITIGGVTKSAGSSTANIINSLSVSKLTSSNATNLTVGITINGKASADKTLTDLIARQLSQTSISSLSTFTNADNLIYAAAGGSNSVTDKPTGVDAFGVFSFKTASGWYGQLLISSNLATGIYWRTATSLSNGWKKLLDSSNYTDYVYGKIDSDNRYVNVIGDTMTGDLILEANLIFTKGGTNQNRTFSFKRTGSNTNIDIGWDWTNKDGAGFALRSVDFPGQSGYFCIWARNSAGTTCQMEGRPDGTLTWGGNKIIHAGNYTDYTVTKTGTGASGTWNINITGNAATADKWKTARTLTIGDKGKLVDGSDDVSWTLSEIGVYGKSDSDDRYVNVIGDTMTGTLVFNYKADNALIRNTYGSTVYNLIRNHNNGNISISASSKGLYIGYENTTEQHFYTGGNDRMIIDSSGNVRPAATNTYILGSSSYRWKALYIGIADSYGSATKPIYWNAGVPAACTYELKATVNAGAANRMAYYSGANAINQASSIYASTNAITINGTLVPANNGNFQVIGTSTMRHIYPEAHSTYNLGTESFMWKYTYTKILNGAITGGTRTKAGGDQGSSANPRYFPEIWTFNSAITPTNGDIITIKTPAGGHDYGVFLSTNNGTNYYPITLSGTVRMTTHFPTGSYLTLLFDSSNSAASMFALAGQNNTSRVTISGGTWRVINYYDSGNTDVRYQQTIYYNHRQVASDGAIRRYTLCMMNYQGKLTSLTLTDNNTGTSKTMYTGYLDPRKIYYWAHTDNYAAGANMSRANTLLTHNGDLIDYRYTFNCGTTLTPRTSFYIVGTIDNNGFKLDPTQPWSCSLPTTDDGKVYIYVGMVYTDTNGYRGTLEENNTIYVYKNGAVQIWSGNAEYTKLLSPISENIRTGQSNWNIPSGSTQVWGQKWTYKTGTKTYTPSGGSATNLTDSGDWTIWLTPSATSNAATLNMRIDGTYYGSFSGNLSGNASTATKLQTARTINGTTFDGSANIITSFWGTARKITIGASGKSVNGSANVSWTLGEIIGTTAIGSLTNPIYWTGSTFAKTTYELKATVNAGTANRMAYYSGANAISQASSIYASTNAITINGTLVPANSGNFQVIGTSTMRHIYPEAHSTYNLGTESFMWKYTYTKILNGALTDGSNTNAVDSGASASPNRYKPMKWSFNSNITPANGDIITIKTPGGGHDYGVFLSTNNGTNYYPITLSGTGRMTTHFPTGSYLTLLFDSSNSAESMFALNGSDSRTKVSGGTWRVINYYDSGNPGDWNLRQYTIKAATAITGVHLIGGTDSGYNHIDSGTAFDIRYPILYAGSNISAGGAGNNNYIHHYSVNIRNSSNANISGLTAYKNVYIKGTISGTIFTPISGGNPYTQTITESDDGYVYYYIGRAYGTNAITFDGTGKDIYIYKDDKIQRWSGTSDYALKATVNDGTANRIAWYSGANSISSASSIYASNNALTINGTSTPDNSGNFQVIGTSTLQHTYPQTTNTYNLGSSSLRWKAIFIGTADSYGSATKPIYWNTGVPAACTYELKSTVNGGTANRMAYYSGANAISAGSIVTDGGYLGSVTYLSVNTAHQTSYRLYVDGTGYFTGTVTSTASPGFANDVAANNWAYIRFKSGTTSEWHVGTNSSTVGILGQANAFEIRDAKSSYTGIAVRYNTSSYGKLVVTSKSGEASIGLRSGTSGNPQWVFGIIDATNYRFGFWNTAGGVWRANFSQNGYLYLGDGNTAASERLHVSGNTRITGDIRIEGNDEYLGTGTGAQVHMQYDNTLKCINFIFD